MWGRSQVSNWRRTARLLFVVAAFIPVSSLRVDGGQAPSLVVRWLDPHRLFSNGGKSVGQQTVRIFSEFGVSIDWQIPSEGGISIDDIFSLRVLLVKSDPSSWGLPAGAMGAVLSKTAPQKAIYVFFPAVLRTLGYQPKVLVNRFLRGGERRRITRALSRVVAHEVIHAVVPSMPHTDDGLTRFKLDRAFLLGPKSPINPDSVEIFRRELMTLLLPNTEAAVTAQLRQEPESVVAPPSKK